MNRRRGEAHGGHSEALHGSSLAEGFYVTFGTFGMGLISPEQLIAVRNPAPRSFEV